MHRTFTSYWYHTGFVWFWRHTVSCLQIVSILLGHWKRSYEHFLRLKLAGMSITCIFWFSICKLFAPRCNACSTFQAGCFVTVNVFSLIMFLPRFRTNVWNISFVQKGIQFWCYTRVGAIRWTKTKLEPKPIAASEHCAILYQKKDISDSYKKFQVWELNSLRRVMAS